MLGAVRRYGVAHALRASVPRSSVRATPQLLKWQPTPASRLPSAARLIHNAPPTRSSASAAFQEDVPAQSEEPLREFADLAKQGLVDPTVINTISKMGISTMTDVQSQTLRETLKGDDVLAQAKTGTGKTLAFLIPVMQSLMNNPPPPQAGRNRREVEIRGLIISPTRELAEQIAVQANMLAKGTGVVVHTAVGGSGKMEGLRKIRREGCDLLIGTPGRLKDVLSDPYAGIKTSTLSSFVLDEADRLLDDGFAPEIMKIQDLLPNPLQVDRQTLMFSATVPREVMHMVRSTMKPKFNFVKTVRDDEVPTHLSVPQKVVQLHSLANSLPALLEIAKNYIAQSKANPGLRPFKAIVYFNTAAEVNVAYDAVRRMDPDNRNRFLGSTLFYLMHARLTQNQRTRNAEYFRRNPSSILLSSDVTARGMDFPDVTHVIQVGAPRARDSYIHRLGRTARANKTGEGWVLLPREQMYGFNDILGDLPIEQDTKSLATPTMDMSRPDGSPEAMEIVDRVKSGMAHVDPQSKRDAYMAQLNVASSGNDAMKRRNMESLNNLAIHGYQMDEPPSLSPLIATRLGLSRVPGVNIGHGSIFSDMVGGDGKMSGGGFGGRRGGYGNDRNSYRYGNRSPMGGRDFGGRDFRGRDFGGRDFGGRDSQHGRFRTGTGRPNSRFADRDQFRGSEPMSPRGGDRRGGGLF